MDANADYGEKAIPAIDFLCGFLDFDGAGVLYCWELVDSSKANG